MPAHANQTTTQTAARARTTKFSHKNSLPKHHEKTPNNMEKSPFNYPRARTIARMRVVLIYIIYNALLFILNLSLVKINYARVIITQILHMRSYMRACACIHARVHSNNIINSFVVAFVKTRQINILLHFVIKCLCG